MLHSVKLDNFGPHESFEHEFEPGLNLVYGTNGVGKSNIVYGIGWAMFGPRALPSEYVQADILNDGADHVRSEVTLDLLGSEHTFIREYDGRGVSAQILRGGEEVANGASGVDEYLMEYGIDWHSASVLFSRQRELDAFVYATPSERKTIFESLLRLEAIEDARKDARVRGKTPDQMPAILQQDTDAGDLEDAVDEAADRLKKAEAALEEVESDIEQLREQREDLRQKIHEQEAETEEEQDKRDALKKKISLLRQKQRNVEGDIERLTSKIDAAPDWTQQEYDSSRLQLKEFQEAEVQGKEEIEELRDLRSELVQKDGQLSEQLSQAKKQYKAISSGKCAVCGSPIEDPEEHLREHLGTTPEEIEAQIEKNAEKLDSVSSKKKLTRRALDVLASRISTLENKIRDWEEAQAVKPQVEDLEEKAKNYHAEIEQLSEERDSLAISGADPKLVEKLNTVSDSLDTANEHLMDVTRRRDGAEALLEDAKKALTNYVEAEKEWKELEVERKHWTSVTRHLTNFRDQVLQDALNWVSLRATQVVQLAGTLPDLGPNSLLTLDSDLKFWFQDDDGDTFPVYRYSGGQKAVFAICLRMALSDYFSDRLGMQGFLLLDAVFERLSDENRDAMAAALASAGPQQAIIFHYEDVPDLDAHRLVIHG